MERRDEVEGQRGAAGKWPAGLLFAPARTGAILAGRVREAEARPMWSVARNVAKYFVLEGGANRAQMRVRVNKCRWGAV